MIEDMVLMPQKLELNWVGELKRFWDGILKPLSGIGEVLRWNLNRYQWETELISNFFSLAILQGANYLLPLITFPYLVRVLGVEKFGLLAFATATIAYFSVIVDYGFNLTATKDVSINRDNIDKLNEIFSSVMVIKFILLLISFIILVFLTSTFNKFGEYSTIFYLTFGML